MKNEEVKVSEMLALFLGGFLGKVFFSAKSRL
jgi:hypothetical protein